MSLTVPLTSPSGETLDQWKARFGITDMTADPDGDGVSNLDEFRNGTDPFIPNTWTLAEGATGIFRTRLAITNPGTDTAEITVRFLPQGGTPIVQQYSIPGQSRKTVVANDIAGLENAPLSAEITTQRGGVLVERTMTWGGAEKMDSASTGKAVARAPYRLVLRRGRLRPCSTRTSCWPTPVPSTRSVTVTFMLTSGQTVQAGYVVPANGRQSVYANTVPGVGEDSFGMSVQATSPITAERSMYFSTRGHGVEGRSLVGWRRGAVHAVVPG